MSSSSSSSTDGNRLGSFFARCSLLSTLLQSRLALPLLYPLNPRAATDSMSLPPLSSNRWDRHAVSQSLGHVTPAIIALTKFTKLLKAGHALSHYKGGIVRHTRGGALRESLEERARRRIMPCGAVGVAGHSGVGHGGVGVGGVGHGGGGVGVGGVGHGGGGVGISEVEQVGGIIDGRLGVKLEADKLDPKMLWHTHEEDVGDGKKAGARTSRSSVSSRSNSRGSSRVHFLRPQLWRMLQPGNEQKTKHLHWR
eukprot:GHVS01012921.1.p1 GENE.GHVS01012921.1~~GHVS01012921.1.p1  ORF type:complete len:253 (-),score=56.12 GHVS01012921.1:355-1113(-)